MNKTTVFRKAFALILALGIIFSGLPVLASDAAGQYNANVAAKVAELEQRFGIQIKYPMTTPYVGIGPGTLNTLENSLENLTPALVGKLSAWCRERTGSRLTIEFSYRPSFTNMPGGADAQASYTPEKALIELMVPRPNGDSFASGATPIAITHEIGHVFYRYLTQVRPNTASQWRGLSPNGHRGDYRKDVFVSEYAATNEEEDFCETFAFGFVSNRPGFSISAHLRDSAGNNTALGRKINFIGTMIQERFPDAAGAVTNLGKSRQVPTSVTWNGLNISGSSLEFIGYSAPHNVIRPLLRSHNLTTSEDPKWDSKIGGWVVSATNGTRHLLFPSGGIIKL